MGKFSLDQRTSITQEKMILVEGQDEAYLFRALIKQQGLEDQIDVASFDGIKKLGPALKALRRIPGHQDLTAIGIVRDAEQDKDRAFQSVCDSLRGADLPQPPAPREFIGSEPRIGVLILPVGPRRGNLEDVCLMSVQDNPAMECVERYFQCLGERLDRLPGTHLAKACVKSFLVSRELLEESHFEFIQQHLEEWVPQMPNAPSVEKIHAFLASRYNPKLDLGGAAGKGYWDFNHPAFEEIKRFLRMLCLGSGTAAAAP
jgi:hypothetical protein